MARERYTRGQRVSLVLGLVALVVVIAAVLVASWYLAPGAASR